MGKQILSIKILLKIEWEIFLHANLMNTMIVLIWKHVWMIMHVELD